MSNRRKPANKTQKETPQTIESIETEPAEAQPRRAARPGRYLAVALLSILGPLAAVAIGLYIYLVGGRFVETDNAYVKADKIAVSADVSGRVVEVAVRENQRVERGDLLFRIDPEPFRIALDQAEARLSSARREIGALQAQHRQKRAELKLAEGDVEYYQQQFERQKNLNTKGFSSETRLETASKDLRNARDQVGMIEEDIAQVLARLGGEPDLPVAEHPQVREAKAARDEAALDLRRTRVRASTDGVVTNFELQRGEYIETGDTIFSLVAAGEIWVAANFRETDLTHVRSGQPATVRVDTYPDTVWEAEVESISPATGSEFALLPPQNATGNWVKVVQRLPVRLRLNDPPQDPPLRAGMSVIAEIDTGHRRQLPDLFGDALDWARNLL